MKKLILSIAIVLGLSMTTFAGPGDGGLFGGGYSNQESIGLLGSREGEPTEIATPGLPKQHNMQGNQDAPLGSGVIMLLGLGAAYAFTKKKEE